MFIEKKLLRTKISRKYVFFSSFFVFIFIFVLWLFLLARQISVKTASKFLLQDVLCQVFVFLFVGRAESLRSISYCIKDISHAGI